MNETEKKSVLMLIGLSKKAGKLISGAQLVCDSLAAGKVHLVVYSAQAAENSQKRMRDRAAYYGVMSIPLDVSPEELGKSVGKFGSVAAVGITDRGFSEAILKKINN